MGFEKLKQLRDTQGNIAKVEFIKANKDDVEFTSCLRFLLDPLITTNISRNKWDKATPTLTSSIGNIQDLLVELSIITGKSNEVDNLKAFAEDYAGYEKEVIEGLINKDYTTNFGDKMWLEVFPNDRIGNVSYLGCSSFSEKKLTNLLSKNDWLYAEVKNDGQFLFAFVYENKVVFRTRKGLEQSINGVLVENLLALRRLTDYDFVLTGEALIKDFDDRGEANGILRGISASNFKILDGDEKEEAKFSKKNGITIAEVEDRLQYVVWDLIPMDKYVTGLDETPYSERRDNLGILLACLKTGTEKKYDSVIQTNGIIVMNRKDIFEYFYYNLEKGLEGIVLKSPSTPFKDGKPTSQLKFKIEFECELEVVGFERGKPATKFENTLGSLLCKSSDGLLITGVSGLSDELRDMIWGSQEEWLGKIITVKCNGTSTNAQGGTSLMYANFREDRSGEKDRSDSLNEILDIERACLELGK